MTTNTLYAAIKATDSLEQLAALIPTLGTDQELLAVALDHEQLLVELDCFGPVSTTTGIDSKTSIDSNEEQVEVLELSERTAAAAAAAIGESAEEVEIKEGAGAAAGTAAVGGTTGTAAVGGTTGAAAVVGATTGTAAVVGAAAVVPAPVAGVASVASGSTAMTSLEDTLNGEAFPHVRWKKGKSGLEFAGLLATIQNTQHMLSGYGITCQYNEMSRRIELDIPGMTFTSDNKANAAVSHIKSLSRRNGLPVSEIGEYIVAIAENNSYHPVRNWIASKPWDGVSRMADIFDTLVVDYEFLEHRDALLRRWMLSAVAAAFCNTPEKFEGVLTLQGEQGIGKTSWLLALAPSTMGAVLDGFSLDPDNKDSVLQFNAHWIVELGELDGVFRKSDVAKLKAFISKKDDALRRAYAAMESFYKRRTVSAATVNGDAFLVDGTGNRRWWTIPVKSIKFGHGIDIQQLWAEVYEQYKSGEQWWLTDVESKELMRVNGQHEQASPIDELIRDAFIFGQAELEGIEPGKKPLRMNATGVAKALGLPFDKKAVTNEIADALRRLTGKKAKPHGKGKYWELYAFPAKWTEVQHFAF